MPTIEESFTQLLSAQEAAERWTTGPLNITIATSKTNDQPISINLSDTIGHNKRVPRENKRDDNTCYWLHSSLNTNVHEFRVQQIHPMFVNAARDAGFIAHGKYVPSNKSIRFSCLKGDYHNDKKSKEYTAKKKRDVINPSLPPIPRKRKTKKAIKPQMEIKHAEEEGDNGDDDEEEESSTCKVAWSVFWDEDSKRWFLPKQQSGCLHHSGHTYTLPQNVPIQSKFVPKDELKIAKDALETKISATASSSLLKKRTGIDLAWHQLQYLNKKDKNNLITSPDGKNSTHHATPVDRLLADLKADPEVSFVCLFGDVSSGLLTIKTKRKNVNNSMADELFLDDLGDSTDSPQDFARDMTGKENLIHTDSGQMLLAIAWTNNKARRKFDMYPEFMGGDDTEDTNAEKRPLYTLMGKDNILMWTLLVPWEDPTVVLIITSCISTRESLSLLMQTATKARLY